MRDVVARMPPMVFYLAAALVQVVLIGLMVFDRMRILQSGSEILLRTRAVDPRDLLRGDYVALRYDASSVPSESFSHADIKKTVFVRVVPQSDGFYEALSAHRARVAVLPPERLLQARVTSVCSGQAGCDRMQVSYGLERYFVPQGQGRELERARNESRLSVVAAVTDDGRVAIKRLLLDSKPVYDEPLF